MVVDAFTVWAFPNFFVWTFLDFVARATTSFASLALAFFGDLLCGWWQDANCTPSLVMPKFSAIEASDIAITMVSGFMVATATFSASVAEFAQ